eukprot:753386-Hanusia_phi.AAC.4
MVLKLYHSTGTGSLAQAVPARQLEPLRISLSCAQCPGDSIMWQSFGTKDCLTGPASGMP